MLVTLSWKQRELAKKIKQVEEIDELLLGTICQIPFIIQKN